MPAPIEREVKLRFGTADEARAAVLAAGAVPLRPRRLQDDGLYDTADGLLMRRRCALRLRNDGGACLLTFKGPPRRARVKTRQELETGVVSAEAMRAILEALGFAVAFRYQKYREEFGLHRVVIAVDETPVGTFVEIEGSERDIGDATARLGRTATDYILDSYRTLFHRHREAAKLPAADMLFDPTT